MRQVVVYKTPQEDWIAECPSLPGCAVRAHSKAEAIGTIRYRINEYIDELRAQNAPVPEDKFEVSVVLV